MKEPRPPAKRTRAYQQMARAAQAAAAPPSAKKPKTPNDRQRAFFDEPTAVIYGLCDPRTGALRYIGKANRLKSRILSHLRDAPRRNTPVYTWLRSLLQANLLPSVLELCVCARSDWERYERTIIAEWRGYNMPLLNIADGGNQPVCAQAVRAENGRRVAKALHADPLRRRISQLKKDVGLALRKGWYDPKDLWKLRYAAKKAPEFFGKWANL